MSPDAITPASDDTGRESDRRELAFVIHEIIARLDESLEADSFPDIRELIGESHRLVELLSLQRQPISWAEHVCFERFRKHIGCGWPGTIVHPWSDTLSEGNTKDVLIALSLYILDPLEEDGEWCFFFSIHTNGADIRPAKDWVRISHQKRTDELGDAKRLLRRWVRVLEGPAPLRRRAPHQTFVTNPSGRAVAGDGRATKLVAPAVPATLPSEVLEELSRMNTHHKEILRIMRDQFSDALSGSTKAPSAAQICKYAMKKLSPTRRKQILGQMVTLNWLDNGKHHGLRGGYFMTARGALLASHLKLSAPGLVAQK